MLNLVPLLNAYNLWPYSPIAHDHVENLQVDTSFFPFVVRYLSSTPLIPSRHPYPKVTHFSCSSFQTLPHLASFSLLNCYI